MREKILTILKFFFFIAIIPILIASIESFQSIMSGLRPVYRNSFYSGIGFYIVIYLLLTELQPIYKSAKSIVEEIFKLIPPFDKIIPYIIPFYVILTAAVYFLIHEILKMGPGVKPYFFLMGFLLSLHIVLAAREFQLADKIFWKPNYLFAISLCFIGTIFTVILLFDLITSQISFQAFWFQLCRLTDEKYEVIFRQILTLVKSTSLF